MAWIDGESRSEREQRTAETHGFDAVTKCGKEDRHPALGERRLVIPRHRIGQMAVQQ
jgi:hypothetical protein